MTKSEKTLLKEEIVNKLKKKLEYSHAGLIDNPNSLLKLKQSIPVAKGTKFIYNHSSGTSYWIAEEPNEVVSLERLTSTCFEVHFKNKVATAAPGWITEGLEYSKHNELPLAAMPLEVMRAIAAAV